LFEKLNQARTATTMMARRFRRTDLLGLRTIRKCDGYYQKSVHSSLFAAAIVVVCFAIVASLMRSLRSSAFSAFLGVSAVNVE
jgi:hypothetical protein